MRVSRQHRVLNGQIHPVNNPCSQYKSDFDHDENNFISQPRFERVHADTLQAARVHDSQQETVRLGKTAS